MSTDAWWISTLLAGTMILVLGCAGGLALRRSSALENALWRTVVLLVLVMPIVTTLAEQLPMLRWKQLRWMEHLNWRTIDLSTSTKNQTSSDIDLDRSALLPPLSVPSLERSGRMSLRSVLLLGWGLGLALSLSRMGLGIIRVRHLRRASRPLIAQENLRSLEACARVAKVSCPALRIGKNLPGPLLVGWVQPCIVLPEGDETPSREVLLHELAHLKRRDLWWLTLGRMAGALWWFHPLVWRMMRRLERSAEEVCDDLVLSWTDNAADFAAELLSYTSKAHERRLSFSGVAVTGFHSGLGKRISRLLVPGRTLQVGIGRAALGLLVSGAAVALALLVAIMPGRSQSLPTPHEDGALSADITVQGTVIALPRDQAAEFLRQLYSTGDSQIPIERLQTLVETKKATSTANPAFSMKNHFRCSSESRMTLLEVESNVNPDGTIHANVILNHGTNLKINTWLTANSGDLKFLGSGDARETGKDVTYFAFVRFVTSQ